MSKEEILDKFNKIETYYGEVGYTKEDTEEAMYEYATILLKAQEEKHKEEMEKFTEWVSLNDWYYMYLGENKYWHNDARKTAITTTELIEMFKKSLDIK